MNDLKFAIRQLLKNPGFTAVAVLTLGLGIGGTTAVFSVADKALLNPIPGPGNDRLVTLQEVDIMHTRRWQVSPPLIRELAGHTNLIESVTWYHQSPEEKKLRVEAATVTLRGAAVAPNFFQLLNLQPVAGRTFLPEEGTERSGRPIIISHGLWQRNFGGSAHAIGQDVELDGERHSVVGIMPPNVQFPFGEEGSQFWIPRSFTSEELDSDWAAINRMWVTIARLREGVAVPELQSLLEVIASRRAASVNQDNQRWTIEAESARHRFTSERLRQTVWYLLATLGALLLIACANVGNLLLSRALERHGEFGIRMALGAGGLRLARQVLVESFTLAGCAAVAAVFVGWGGVIALERLYLSELPRINVMGLDWGILGFTCGVATVAGAVFGTAPAWFAARINLNQSLKESSPFHSGGVLERLFHDGLTVVQVCLAVVLVVGASLMIFSVIGVLRVDPGLEAKGLYRVQYDAFDFANARVYDVEAAIERGVPREQAFREQWRTQVNRFFTFQRVALERLHAAPGVDSASVNAGGGFDDYELAGRPGPVSLSFNRVSVVEGDYLRTVGAKLVAGRLLAKEDATPGQQGVVVNERLAAHCWPGDDPLGKQFVYPDRNVTYAVVGVVQNIEDWTLDAEVKPAFYEPYERETESLVGIGDFVVRSSANPEQLRDALAQAGAEMLVPVELRAFYSVETQLLQSTAPRRVMMWLLVSLGGLGLLLSMLGVYAVLACSVARRVREVGIRLALGAGRGQVRSLFVRHGARLIMNGMALGIVVAFTAVNYVESLLYGVTITDPWQLASVLLALGSAGGVACWLPARKAAKLNPIEALRHE